jgi:hypothetical protein
MVVHRFELRPTVARIIRLLLQPKLEASAEPAAERRRQAPEEAPLALLEVAEDDAAAEPAPVVDGGGNDAGDELRQ